MNYSLANVCILDTDILTKYAVDCYLLRPRTGVDGLGRAHSRPSVVPGLGAVAVTSRVESDTA